MNFDGERRLFVNAKKAPKTIEGLKSYRYPERDGQVLNESPIKENDDCCDSLRYFVVNYLDDDLDQKIITRAR